MMAYAKDSFGKLGQKSTSKPNVLAAVDLRRSKPLISLVPFNLYFHYFQG